MSGQRSELLNLLGDVKAKVQDRLGAVDFPMPQFILLGKQSVGKSRLIETFAGETFNFISGTLGSRRPTVLEFRNVPSLAGSRWSVRNAETAKWEEHTTDKVMEIVGKRHEELGNDVSSDPIHVRVEGPSTVDMQIVDLPGFRDFALDESKQALATKIEELVLGFMRDKNNTMLCVEQANDAATMSTLQRCREFDPTFDRTILVRNKLDKYYDDLTPANVGAWVDGHGDLPPNLVRFAVTLPFWKDGTKPPKPFSAMTDERDACDLSTMAGKKMEAKHMSTIGFKNFSAYMGVRVEQMFVAALGPILTKLKDFKAKAEGQLKDLDNEFANTDPEKLMHSTRECGISFASGLEEVMKGQLGLDYTLDLEQELLNFHANHPSDDRFLPVPTSEFAGVVDYIDYLRDEASLASFDVKLNGGSQFRRLMSEVEIFLRFSEISADTKKRDVIQARGVSMSSLTWKDVVVKLLGNGAHLPMLQRVRYCGLRIRWFFVMQKDPVLDWMTKLEGKSSRGYSALLPQAAKTIRSNEITKHLLYECWDNAATRQLDLFLELFDNMLTSTFSNPWVFLKTATIGSGDEDMSESPDESLRHGVPREIESRAGSESILENWFNEIPTEETQIDIAVDKVQMVVLKTYCYIRAQICDQVEIFSESFFKIPMLRQLSNDMANIAINAEDLARFADRRGRLEADVGGKKLAVTDIDDCIKRITMFKLKNDATKKK